MMLSALFETIAISYAAIRIEDAFEADEWKYSMRIGTWNQC